MPSRKSKYQSLSDEELYALIVSGSDRERNEAFEELYARYSGRVYLYCLKTLGDHAAARDACQETFIAFWRSASPQRQMTNLRGYLLRIARNTCLIAKRHETAQPTTEFNEDIYLALAPNPLGEAAVEQNELVQLVTMALDLLPDHYREAIVLQCYNNLSYQEVADTLGVPLSTVRNWIVRAKAHLRKILEPYWEDPSSGETLPAVKTTQTNHHE
ncbi:MAG: RNA polymerase sigma factor [Candidatus Kapaibacterium sp.]|nr:MAG: RNA polymerase sigma factor [Candidatus Kapabacteria bacterium]